MTTGNMPNPPDHLSTQAASADVSGQDAAGLVGAGEGADGQGAAVGLGAEIAQALEGEVDVIAQQMVYHSQIMFGVSAMGTDAVNARNSVLIVANALRSGSSGSAVKTLANLSDSQIAQVNDRTLPFSVGSQIAGLFEGLLADCVTRAFKGDGGKQREARIMLERIFQAANEQALAQPKGLVAFQAPGPGPNSRR